MMGPSYTVRQDANRLDQSHRLLSEHNESSAQFNLSSSQARRSRAARFGTSRHATYDSPLPARAAEDDDETEQLALSYASPTGTSTSSIYLPEYVAWAVSQLIAASNDPKLLRADHLKLAHLTDPQEHMAEAAHIPPKRSSLLHLATVSPHRYAAILAVLSEVRQRLSSSSPIQGSSDDLDKVLPRWTPDTVLDFDCAAGEGLWAAAHVFRQDEADLGNRTSLQRYFGYDRRPNLLKSGKKVAQSSASNVSPADPKRPDREVKLKDRGEEIVVDGVTYYEQEPSAEGDEPLEEVAEEDPDAEPALEYFSGPISAMASVEKTFQSVPLAKDIAAAGKSGSSLALSAFALSLMTNDSNRFEAVQAMWDSGADVIVVIDQATPRGFASVASARAQLIQLGKQNADQGGAHVVAPCSHDKPCPLLHPFAISSSIASAVGVRSDTGNPVKSKDVCGFTARYHTPAFLRRTKHSDRGEENVEYSYVVVRRGPRPSLLGEAQRRLPGESHEGLSALVKQLSFEAHQTKTGILDMLRSAKKASAERRMLEEVDPSAALASPRSDSGASPAVDSEVELTDDEAMKQLLTLLPDAMKAELSAQQSSSDGAPVDQLTPEQMDGIMASIRSSLTASEPDSGTAPLEASTSGEEEQGVISVPAPTAESELAMRLESYSWPRLIRSPLKKGGHVTFDACCASGNIERFTISKAAGKQAYQDARKSKWGDLFPHPPRTRSVVKVLNPLTALEYQAVDSGANTDQDLMAQLVLRAPSKLGKKVKSKDKIQVLGLEPGEDADSVLRELFEDMHPNLSPFEPQETEASAKRSTVDRGVASYRLISPNLVTPTKKQEKRAHIHYANRWNQTQLALPPTACTQARQPQPDMLFESSLQSAPTDQGSRVRISRSSRKKSRGDWNQELFGS